MGDCFDFWIKCYAYLDNLSVMDYKHPVKKRNWIASAIVGTLLVAVEGAIGQSGGYALPPRGYVIPSPQGRTRPPVVQRAQPAQPVQPPRAKVVQSSVKPASTKTAVAKATAKSNSSKSKSPTPTKTVAKSKSPAKSTSKSAAIAKQSTSKSKTSGTIAKKTDRAETKVASSKKAIASVKEVARKEASAISRDVKEAAKDAKSILAGTAKAASPKPLEAREIPVPPPGSAIPQAVPTPAPAAALAADAPPPPAIIRTPGELPAHLTGSATMLPLAITPSDSVGATALANAAKKTSAAAEAPRSPRSAIVSGLAAPLPAPVSTPPPAVATSVEVPSPAVVKESAAPAVEVAAASPAPAPAAPAPDPAALAPSAPPPVEVIPNRPLGESPAVIANAGLLPGTELPEATVQDSLPSAPPAPPALNVMEITARNAQPVNDIPLEAIAADTAISTDTPTPFLLTNKAAKLTDDDLPPAAAPPPAPSKPAVAVTPSMKHVRPTAYQAPTAPSTAPSRPTEIQPSPDFFPSPPAQPEAAFDTPELPVNPKLGAMTIDAERADSDNEKNTVTFSGNVSVDCKRFALRADRVVSHLRPKTKGGGTGKVEAFGKVIVHMNGENGRGYTATGSKAIFDPENETIRLTGWPKIEEAGKALIANSPSTEILIDTRSSRLTTTGATKTLLNR